MKINKELNNKLIEIIKKAQPITKFSGNTIQYGSQIFILPSLPPQDINNTKLSFR